MFFVSGGSPTFGACANATATNIPAAPITSAVIPRRRLRSASGRMRSDLLVGSMRWTQVECFLSIADERAQRRLVNLADRRCRERRNDRPGLGHLVTRERRAGSRFGGITDGFGIVAPLAHSEHRVHALAPQLVRNSKDARIRHAWHSAQNVLDFVGNYVFAARFDQLLLATDNVNESARVTPSQIAGMKPAAGHRLAGRIRLVPVAEHQGFAAIAKLARFAFRHRMIRIVEQRDGHSWRRIADRGRMRLDLARFTVRSYC